MKWFTVDDKKTQEGLDHQCKWVLLTSQLEVIKSVVSWMSNNATPTFIDIIQCTKEIVDVSLSVPKVWCDLVLRRFARLCIQDDKFDIAILTLHLNRTEGATDRWVALAGRPFAEALRIERYEALDDAAAGSFQAELLGIFVAAALSNTSSLEKAVQVPSLHT